jgi:hypothetical protein
MDKDIILKLINLLVDDKPVNQGGMDDYQIGNHVIIRTYSAGVWFGILEKKCKKEVILKNARRMWRWKAKEGISLSAVAQYGIDQTESRIAGPVETWLEAIEIIPCSGVAIESIKNAKEAKQL